MTRLQAAVLRQGVATRANILVAAGTSTGKTTLTKPSVGLARVQWQVTAPPDVRINYAVCLELVGSRYRSNAGCTGIVTLKPTFAYRPRLRLQECMNWLLEGERGHRFLSPANCCLSHNLGNKHEGISFPAGTCGPDS